MLFYDRSTSSSMTRYHSLLHQVFKPRFCFSVVSGCFVDRVSSSLPLRPKLAKSMKAQSWLLEGSKVPAKCVQNLLGHDVAWQGWSLQAQLC